MYMFNKLIRHLVILVFKCFASVFLVVLFVVFQKLRKSYVENILEFIDTEIARDQSKTYMEILTVVFVVHHIGGR